MESVRLQSSTFYVYVQCFLIFSSGRFSTQIMHSSFLCPRLFDIFEWKAFDQNDATTTQVHNQHNANRTNADTSTKVEELDHMVFHSYVQGFLTDLSGRFSTRLTRQRRVYITNTTRTEQTPTPARRSRSSTTRASARARKLERGNDAYPASG